MIAKRNRGIIFAIIFIFVAIGLIAGGSYALFTQNILVNNHLESANLEASLHRTSHTSQYYLNGYKTGETVAEENVDFSGNNSSNAFGLPENALIAPTCVQTGIFKISNNGNIAFDYYVEFKLTGESDEALASQLLVSVQEVNENGEPANNGHSNEFTMDEATNGKYLANDNSKIGTVDAENSGYFKITVTFVDDGISEESARTELDEMNNNDAQEQNVYFDMIIHCVQNTDVQQLQP
jgi:hypothetical protein